MSDKRSVVPESRLGIGFAAGCEAVALPRRKCLLKLLGYALSWFLNWKSDGLSPHGWDARLLSAGHSHRLTSGGKAEPKRSRNLAELDCGTALLIA